MQKFTEEEKSEFQTLKASTLAEIEEKYKEQKAPLLEIISKPNYNQIYFLPEDKSPTKDQRAKASEQAKEANARLKEEKDKAKKALREIEEAITREARALLKDRFNYPIFMYDAEKVGITATGEPDYNELYPNDNKPPEMEKSCLEWYKEFQDNSKTIMQKTAE